MNQLLGLGTVVPEAAQPPVQRVASQGAGRRRGSRGGAASALKAGVELGFQGATDDSDQAAPNTTQSPPEASLVTNLAPQEVTVMGTPILLGEAVVNLVDNAIRYGGRGAEIDVAVHHDGHFATVGVRDTGPGLSPDQLEAVLGRSRGTQEGSGCGLGLAIVREVAERDGEHGDPAERAAWRPAAELRLPLAYHRRAAGTAESNS